MRYERVIVTRYGGSIRLIARGPGLPGAAFIILLPSATNPSEANAGSAE